ncbi:MAG TPA: ribonuclease P protein component [Pirellulales bacterium]|nr:ribonuclease P protein component [Pirellulales bacterium]
MPDQSFPKQLRLRSRVDFRRVYERRCSLGDGFVRLLGRLNELPHPRLGLSVSRDCGNAVQRNRWKRLLREAFRLSRPKLPTGVDFIVVPRATDPPKLNALAKSIVDLSWRLAKRLKREAAAKSREERNSRAQTRSRRNDEE